MLSTFVVVLSSLIGAAAFMTPASRTASRSISMLNEDRSIALPFDKRPPNLDGTLVGDFGFDPAGFSNNPPAFFGGNLKWYREAEIAHGRVAQLAVVGNFHPYLYQYGRPTEFLELNPLKALTTVPAFGLVQIAILIGVIESYRITQIIKGDKEPGFGGIGQGGYNPFNFNYSPEEYREKQLQELKHGRLAMFGAIGLLLQNSISGVSAVDQLSAAFSLPEARDVLVGPGTLNDFFPAGI